MRTSSKRAHEQPHAPSLLAPTMPQHPHALSCAVSARGACHGAELPPFVRGRRARAPEPHRPLEGSLRAPQRRTPAGDFDKGAATVIHGGADEPVALGWHHATQLYSRAGSHHLGRIARGRASKGGGRTTAAGLRRFGSMQAAQQSVTPPRRGHSSRLEFDLVESLLSPLFALAVACGAAGSVEMDFETMPRPPRCWPGRRNQPA
jgi:hypothetical protein